jgi:hypothetical protein
MRNFLKIAFGVDVTPLACALQQNSHLWNGIPLRTAHEESPHKEADDILLWFNEIPEDITDVVNDIQTVPYEAWDELPQCRQIVFDLMRRVEAVQLGRCIITRLKPGAKIDPHSDMGAPVNFYSRFQVCIQSLPGCNFVIDDEQVNFKSGDVWLINNSAEHAVYNNSADDRIVMIVDLRCA